MATTRKFARRPYISKEERAARDARRSVVREAFDFARLKEMCEMHETEVGDHLSMERIEVKQPAPDNYYYFKDNGSKILAVAHLDTVVDHAQRTTVLAETAGGDVVYSGALDDRLGAYVLADLLPTIGAATGADLTFDLLLTVGEEQGASTAAFFEPTRHHEREYNWIIEFDRGGTDVVLYQYEDDDLIERVEGSGADVESGAFSDISFLEHLGVKALNWGVGYRDYHGPRGHVWLDDLFEMVEYFLSFHEANKDVPLPHEQTSITLWGGGYSWNGGTEYEILDETGYEGSTECEVAAWGVGDCDGPLVDRAGYDFICAKHAAWSDTA